ncbi:DUF423 domain-containing protein [Solitalea canadensis]|uniref:Uncharacterized small membrane protein n=1 Tax=Solitalea canadensis (strain ATCC 29591 / DSM 3403 / JCM 21819 / LMG 8368 / NBRC 15130 / NCIMB 12057 / USAM 9D) TaxID=929556 RepID=H8KRN6_SOLCM|nr:DUF423 domain-containing protein [Solitalea canadensis]AFD07617.1 uncharacterized small membrane protein [Solitalea canadensis DSM 3403]
MQKQVLMIASICGALAVALGAFGAHGLKPLLNDYQLSIWEKGVQYQFYHTIVLLVLAFYPKLSVKKSFLRAVWFFLAGIILFSGSLYLLATREVIGFHNATWLGIITPFGGVAFIIGWLSVFIGALRERF